MIEWDAGFALLRGVGVGRVGAFHEFAAHGRRAGALCEGWRTTDARAGLCARDLEQGRNEEQKSEGEVCNAHVLERHDAGQDSKRVRRGRTKSERGTFN